jgi:hypothetical protein
MNCITKKQYVYKVLLAVLDNDIPSQPEVLHASKGYAVASQEMDYVKHFLNHIAF